MANEKILNTRFQFKIDTYANWTNLSVDGQGGNLILKKGEIGICEIPAGSNAATTAPTVLFKVGDGVLPYHRENPNECLKWVSGLAADVYAWAKEGGLVVNSDGSNGNVVSSIAWDATANGGKGGIKYTTASVATSDVLTKLQGEVDAIEKDIADNRENWAKDDNTTYAFTATDKGFTVTPSEGESQTFTFNYLTKEEIEALGYAKTADLGALAGKDTITTSEINDFAVEVAKVKVANAGQADVAERANSADKVANALTVKIGGAEVIYDGSAAKVADVDAAITEAETRAKQYADDNDANTEYHVEYDSANKKIKLVAGADTSKMEIPTDDFIKDGMISSVVIDETTQELVITWNTDAGKEATRLKLSELADIYTGVDGTTIKVEVSSDDKISAEVKAGSLTTSHLAANAGIVKTQLDATVQASLDKADSALQTHQDISGKKNVQEAVVNKITAKAHVLSSLAQNANGDISYEVKELTPADIGAQAAGNYKTTQEAKNYEGSTAKTVTKVTQTANGEVEVTYSDIAFPEPPAVNDGTFTVSGTGALTGSGSMSANQAGNTSATLDVADKGITTAKIANYAVGAQQIKASADYTGEDAEVWVFNCGTSTTII